MTETLKALAQARMDAKGWTLEALAAAADLSPSGLRKLLAGSVRVARGPTVAQLAKALGLAPAKVRAAIEASRAAAERA